MTSSPPAPESKVSKAVDNATNALDNALDILETLSDFTANVPYLNAVTGIIKNLIAIRKAMKSNEERAEVLFEKIGEMTKTIGDGLLQLDDEHRSAAAGALKRDLEKYHKVLVDVVHILTEWKSQSWTKRVLKHGDFDGIADNLEKKIETFRGLFELSRFIALSKGQQETNTMLTTLVDSDTRMKLEKWLKPANVRTNHQDALNKKHPGTGQWLLENSLEFREWIYAPGSFLWLHGISGSGKTVLSSMIIDKIREKQQKVNNLLCSLVYQLSIQLLCPALSKLWENCQKGEILPTNDELLPVLEDFCGQKEIYLLVDALDESSERERLLKLLASILGAKLPKMHLIVTSRTEITEFKVAKEAVLVSLTDSVDGDIELYVRDELSKMEGYIAKHKDVIRQELLKNGDGMFRLVALQLEALQKSSGTKSQVNKALATMPRTLEGIYDRIMDKTNEPEQVCRVMIWLIFTLEEITLGGIRDALAFNFAEDKLVFDEDERMEADALLHACGSLISVSQGLDNSSVVRLSHASVKDYFIGPGSNKWGVSDQSAQKLIAKTCLAYFNSLDSVDDTSLVALDYPLVQYASSYWSNHLNHYKDFTGDPSICDLFLERLQEKNPKYTLLKKLIENYSVGSVIGPLGPPLCLVAYLGIEQGIALVLKQDANINVLGGRYGTALQTAAYQQNINIVQLLLEHGADPNILDGVYDTALRAAAFQENIDIVQLLLEHNAHPNIMGEGGTALQTAAVQQNINIVQLLLEHSADPNIIGGPDGTALQAASCGRTINIVQLLLEHGANPNILGGQYGTALQAAAAQNNFDIVHLLLEHCADPNIGDGIEGTALQAAARQRSIDVVQLLLEHHADPNIRSRQYGTALQAAAITRNNFDVVQLLLEHNADPNITGGLYGTALVAATYEQHIDIVQLLLEHNADPNILGGEWGTALQVAAAAWNDFNAVQLLLEHNTNPNIVGGYCGTALQAAALGDNIDIVHQLLEHGADPNIVSRVDGEFDTALQAAAACGNSDNVKLLLKCGADVNLQGEKLGTALQAAAAYGNIDTVKLLLEHGADVNLQGGKHRTALQAAATKGHSEIVQLLQAHGAM
ncbi:ankyrin repeat-containing domain protein [Mycena sanguinolenta]|nr:ankyrin repeat-containing domain protein [Mycena sanguinolenta]